VQGLVGCFTWLAGRDVGDLRAVRGRVVGFFELALESCGRGCRVGLVAMGWFFLMGVRLRWAICANASVLVRGFRRNPSEGSREIYLEELDWRIKDEQKAPSRRY
jgi:hypothetical protein